MRAHKTIVSPVKKNERHYNNKNMGYTEWRRAVVNAKGKTVIYHKGQWKYKEEVEVAND